MRRLSPAHATRRSAGSDRVLILLTVAAGRDLPRLDGKLFLDVFGQNER
jgi:hypothetical protein